MAKRKEEAPKAGAPAWMATFADFMSLLLTFFILLYSMSSLDESSYDELVAGMQSSVGVFSGGGSSVGEGSLLSNGVSQLNALDKYMNNMGKTAESDTEGDILNEYESSEGTQKESNLRAMAQILEEQSLRENEELSEIIEEAVKDSNLGERVEVSFTSQYVQLSLRGALLFDSGKAVIKEEALPVLNQVGILLERYADYTIEVEGHTDNIPISNGKYENNNVLSTARALSVRDYLVHNTVLNPADIKSSGRGEYIPIADNSTEAGRAKNRRVEIRIYHSIQ